MKQLKQELMKACLLITKVVYASSSSCVHNIDFEHAPRGRS